MLLGTRRALLKRKGQVAAPFVGAYDSIVNLVHVYEPARCTLSAYTGGALLRLRRDSDDAESDFSHVSASNPELDLAAIAAWAGGASYIVTVYDQKGANNITQATAGDQPLFVANIQNGHAGGRFDGTNHYLQIAFAALSQPYSVYCGAKLGAGLANNNTDYYLMQGNDAGFANSILLYKAGATVPDQWRIFAGTNLSGGAADTVWNLWSALFNGASSQFWHNGVAESVVGNAGTQNADGLTVGADADGTDVWNGDWAYSIIADPSHSDAQRGAMQTAINSYWSFY